MRHCAGSGDISSGRLGADKFDKDDALSPYKANVRLLTYCEGESPEPVMVDLLPGGVPSQLPVELWSVFAARS